MSEGFNLPRSVASELVFKRFKGGNERIATRHGEFY